MAEETTTAAPARWPASIDKSKDDLYAIVDDKTGEVQYLVLASSEKDVTLVRDNGTWAPIGDEFIESIDDPDLYNEFVDVDFIDYYDKLDKTGDTIPFKREQSSTSNDESDSSSYGIKYA